jgi:hypothetical protein
MSYHDYQVSKQVAMYDFPFYGLIMAAMRKADTDNTVKLRAAFPEVWDELQTRYNAPGGLLESEQQLNYSALDRSCDDYHGMGM